MNKQILLWICSLMTALTPIGVASFTVHEKLCSPEVKRAIATALSLPELQNLIEQVEKEGNITVQSVRNDPMGFEAYWSPHGRKIVINHSRRRSCGSLIRSLVFELHNAVANKELTALRTRAMRGELSKDAYVEANERVEYQSALSTSRLLAVGINKGLYPRDAEYHVYPRFREHYMLQQLLGHSQQIAHTYNQLCPWGRSQVYRGLLGDVSRLSPDQRGNLLYLIHVSSDIVSRDPRQANAGRTRFSQLTANMKSTDWRRPWVRLIFGEDTSLLCHKSPTKAI